MGDHSQGVGLLVSPASHLVFGPERSRKLSHHYWYLSIRGLLKPETVCCPKVYLS